MTTPVREPTPTDSPTKGSSGTMHFLLSGPAAREVLNGPVGKLAPVLRRDSIPVRFTRLDCFDQSLRLSDRMLLEHGSTWEVILPTGQTIVQTVSHPERHVADIADGPVRGSLADMSPLRRLLPFGTGTLRREELAFADRQGKTRCRADLLTLATGATTVAVIVRLSGLRGYDKALAAVRHHLESCGGKVFAMAALHDHLFPGQPIYRAKPPLDLTAKLSAHDAAARIIARLIPVMVQNEAGICADIDTEFLHDYRVTLRKIRSVLSLFRGVFAPGQTEAVKAQFSALMARTGPLRDLDVQLLDRQAQYDAVPPGLHPGLDVLFNLRAAERGKALTKLASHLKSPRHATDMAALQQLFAAPAQLEPGSKAALSIGALAAALIWKRFKAARKLAQGIDADTPDTAVHALRIQMKKLRYLMDFAAEFHPRDRLMPALRTVRKLQTHLGTVNDLSVQLAALQSVPARARSLPASDQLQLAQSLGALTSVLHQGRRDQRGKAQIIIAEFAGAPIRDRFRDLFHRGTPKE